MTIDRAVQFIASKMTTKEIKFASNCDLTTQDKHVIRRAIKMILEEDVGEREVELTLIDFRCNAAEGDYTYEYPEFTDAIESQSVFAYVLDFFGVQH